MARKKKSTISRKQNLSKAWDCQSKRGGHGEPSQQTVPVETDRRVTIEEVPDMDYEHSGCFSSSDSEFFPDLASCDSSSVSDVESVCTELEVSTDEAHELENEADLASFTAFLTQAQQAAITAENKRVAEGGRKKRGKYSGMAARTKRLHAQLGRERREAYAQTGQQFITQWARAVSNEDVPVSDSHGAVDSQLDTKPKSLCEESFDVACEAVCVDTEQQISAMDMVSKASCRKVQRKLTLSHN
jgi:hypothetical protein